MASVVDDIMATVDDIGDAPFWGGAVNQLDKHYHISKRPADLRCKLHTVFLRDLRLFGSTIEAQEHGYFPCSHCFG